MQTAVKSIYLLNSALLRAGLDGHGHLDILDNSYRLLKQELGIRVLENKQDFNS